MLETVIAFSLAALAAWALAARLRKTGTGDSRTGCGCSGACSQCVCRSREVANGSASSKR